MNTRHKLTILVSERETENTGMYTPFSSEYLQTAIQYAHEHDFPLDFYVNYNLVTETEFRKALAENVEFDQMQMDQHKLDKQYQELVDERHY